MANLVDARTWVVDNLVVNSALILGPGATETTVGASLANTTLTGTTTLTGALTTSATVGALKFSGGSPEIWIGSVNLSFKTNDGVSNILVLDNTTLKVTVSAGSLSFGAAASKIVPGATSISLRNNADSADNLILLDAGDATFRTKITMPGPLVLTTAASKIIPGATTLSLRNNADNADNLIITDAGNATYRGAIGLGVTPAAAANTITWNATGNTGPNIFGDSTKLLFVGGTTGTFWNNQANDAELMRITNAGVLALGTTTTTNAVLGQFVMGGVLFASLPAAVNGTLTYCSNCAPASAIDQTCTGASTGSLAFRVNGAWKCIS